MHDARAVAVVTKGLERERLQVRALLGKHRAHLALGRAMDARVGPAQLPLIQVGLGRLQGLEAQPLKRRALRVPDARFHLAFAIRVAHATGQGHDAVMREDIPIERVELRVVHVG